MFTVQLFNDALNYGLMGRDKMPRFGKGGNFTKQAKAVVLKNVTYGEKHSSRRSTDHDIANLKNIGKWMQDNFNIKFLDEITLDMAHQYLSDRSEIINQDTLKLDRRAFIVLNKRPSSKLYKCKI